MPERRLLVVFLVSKRVDRLVGFYRDTVGLELVSHEPGHSAWFDTGAVQLVVHRPQTEPETLDLVPDAKTILWIEPEEGVDTAAGALQGAGVELVKPRSAANYFFFKDPDGRLIGLHQQDGSEEDDSDVWPGR